MNVSWGPITVGRQAVVAGPGAEDVDSDHVAIQVAARIRARRFF